MKSLLKINRFNLLMALFIILWGAWVRLTGSGAGCGEHWPLCNGAVIPQADSMKTMIEFVHRLTSGFYGLTVLWACYIGRKEFGNKHPAYRTSLAVLFFTIVEALIGAVLVKKGLVDKNDSNLRAIVIALHLVNTLFLVSSHTFVEFFARREIRVTWPHFLSPTNLLFFFVFILTATSGAITALGNTLFPDPSLIAGLAKDFSADAPFLIKLRIYHPMVAVALGLGLIYKANGIKNKSMWYEFALMPMAIIALAFGAVNWLLLSPHWGALTHLLIANILWIITTLCFMEGAKRDVTLLDN